MKILTVEQIRNGDRYTIEDEPISSLDLMERAAQQCVNSLLPHLDKQEPVSIFCGHGNNGGDGLAIARMLHERGYVVEVMLVYSNQRHSDNQENLDRIARLEIPVLNISTTSDIPGIKKGKIVDAMLGTGLTKPLSGIYLECTHAINQSGAEVIAIDIPSGLFERGNKDTNLSVAVRAHRTLSFQYPKLCFFLPECASHIGSWEILDIGIPEAYTSAQETAFFVYGSNEAKIDLQPRSPWGHKGTFGHALLIGGSTGKFGAVILATEACMRSGSGLTSVLTPEDGASALLSRLPEAMLAGNDKQGGHLSIFPELAPYNAIGIGPGLGQHHETAKLLEDLIQQASKPLVVDADALNILSTRPELINELPQGTILTPHPKEFDRLFGSYNCTEERMEFMRGLATQRKLNILLKGHYSISALSDGSIHFNTSGNSGMAKGGSGDVLTGILTGLLSQGYSPEKALPFGVYLHGLAADLAIKRGAQESIIPSDLIDQLGASYAVIAGADHQE